MDQGNLQERVGSPFSVHGTVKGIMVDFLRGKRIVQAWRDKRFPTGIFSMATINLTPTKRGGTELVLTHRGVPKDLIPSIETHWRKKSWEKIKKLLTE
jgi:activator of HSP90 ATPase